MKKITYSQAADRLQTFGRTWYDRATDTLYTNFTCGGFRLRFSGCWPFSFAQSRIPWCPPAHR